ncbi:FAD binding domain protein [Colletotrichum kahawae]|uniref:FAD binding domain protein n=1 Tax=Colletotrichum kahawae TaxID=34407 RepID=A0AAD9YJE9_COLKA|nr:FAD binding domain protein [Colletotrichum kahawae]
MCHKSVYEAVNIEDITTIQDPTPSVGDDPLALNAQPTLKTLYVYAIALSAMSSGFLKDGKNLWSNLWSKATSGVVEQLVRERDKAFVRTSGTIPKRDDIVDDIARASASGIGFFSEAAHYQRDRKRPGSSQEGPRSPELGQESHCERVHEAIWDLDEVEISSGTQPINPNTSNVKDEGSMPVTESTDLATAFLSRHPIKSDGGTKIKSGITMPVVLPQRRPKTRVRGFVRAYAPVLAAAGIDQEAFLDFIDTLNKSLIPNPYLYAINLAGFADIIAPDPALTAFGILLGIAVEGVMEGQSRFKSNNFLDRMNADFFGPRDLMCFVATWRPDDTPGEVPVDFESKTTSEGPSVELSTGDKVSPEPSAPENETLHRIKKLLGERLRSHDRILDWSNPAPLMFPAVNELVLAQGINGQKKKNGLDRAEIWLDDYMDRRAQVEWVNENPELSAAKALPKAEFKSRYADPSHPAASGDVVALVTGGRWQYKRKQTVSEGNIELDASQSKVKVEDGKKTEIAGAEDQPSEGTTDSGTYSQPQLKEEQNVNKSKPSMEDNENVFIGPLTLKDTQKDEKKRQKEVEKAAEIEQKVREEEARKKKKEEKKIREDEKRMEKENEKALQKEKKVEEKRLKKAAEEEKKAGPAETVDDMIKSLFQKDVLYLLIVNLPSPEEKDDAAVEDTSVV